MHLDIKIPMTPRYRMCLIPISIRKKTNFAKYDDGITFPTKFLIAEGNFDLVAFK